MMSLTFGLFSQVSGSGPHGNLVPIVCKKNNQSLVSHWSPMQTEKSQPSDQRIKLGKHRFRHYPFTLGLGCLGLHRKLMTNSIYVHGSPMAICKCSLYLVDKSKFTASIIEEK